MPLTAPDRNILPEGQEPVNSRARYEYRMKVLLDRKLSDGAKVLYCLLDEYARQEGRCWPKQKELAKQLGSCAGNQDDGFSFKGRAVS
jgi:hypothetical protein